MIFIDAWKSLDQAGSPKYCEYDYPNGTKIKVLVRPDDIIHDDESSQTALVIGRVFRGANYLYRLQRDDGQTLLSLVASHHNDEVGSHIGYCSAPRACRGVR